MLIKTAVATSATENAVTLESIKDQLRLTPGWTHEDELLRGLRRSAERWVENKCGLKLLTQTWYSYYDAWPESDDYDEIELPYYPLQSVPSSGVYYTDSSGGSTTFSSTAWDADTATRPSRVVLDYNDDWPSVTLHNKNPIRVEAIYGYTTAGNVPDDIKLAIRLLIAHWYENREAAVIPPPGAGFENVPMAVGSILADYRSYRR